MNREQIALNHLKKAMSLIAHAIELMGLNNICEHESDGTIWEGNKEFERPDELLCTKCGEFYR